MPQRAGLLSQGEGHLRIPTLHSTFAADVMLYLRLPYLQGPNLTQAWQHCWQHVLLEAVIAFVVYERTSKFGIANACAHMSFA